jgi:hypothetical protein
VDNVYINMYDGALPADGGTLIGTCNITNTGAWTTWSTFTGTIIPNSFIGLRNLL